MTNLYDDQIDELLGRGGTFDITGTTAVTDKKFMGFRADAGAVLEAIKGIPLKSAAASAAQITAAEVALEDYFLTALTDPLLADFYRVRGYIITYIKLTSGTLHCFEMKDQPTE